MASKSKKRRRVLGASCILAALIIAGSSFAWFTSKDEVTNRLTANADYGVSIVESFVPPQNWLPGQEINKDVYAVNTGSVDAYVKETITGVLNYTYEQVVTEFDENCVLLSPAEVTAIDGATTEEAGGFLAWTNAKIDVVMEDYYTVDGTEVKEGEGGNIITLATGKVLHDPENVSDLNYDKTFTKSYTVGETTYYLESVTNGAKLYTEGTGETFVDSGKTIAKAQREVSSSTYPTGPVNSARKADEADATNTVNDSQPGVATKRWTPPATGVYIFRRAIDTSGADIVDNTGTVKYKYAGYYFVKGEAADGSQDKYYEIVIGQDSHPLSQAIPEDPADLVDDKQPEYAKWNFDVYVTSDKLGAGVTSIDQDGTIHGNPSIRYVKEEKVVNGDAVFTYNKGDESNPATLNVSYTPGQADTERVAQTLAAYEQAQNEENALLAEALGYSSAAAKAEDAYENALGEYNTKKSRYDQTNDDRLLANDFVTATNKLYKAADDRAIFQYELDKAKQEMMDAWNDNDTTDGKDSVVEKAKELNNTDSSNVYQLVNDIEQKDDSAISFKTLFGDASKDATANATGSLAAKINYLSSTFTATDPNAARFTSMKSNMDQMYTLWNEIELLWNGKDAVPADPEHGVDAQAEVKSIKKYLDELESYNTGTNYSTPMTSARAEEIRADLNTKLSQLKTKMDQYDKLYAALQDTAEASQEPTLTNIVGENAAATTVHNTAENATKIYDEGFKTKEGEAKGLEELINDYKTAYDKWNKMNSTAQVEGTYPEGTLGKAQDDWAKAVAQYNIDVGKAITDYQALVNQKQPELNNFNRLSGNTVKERTLTDQSKTVIAEKVSADADAAPKYVAPAANATTAKLKDTGTAAEGNVTLGDGYKAYTGTEVTYDSVEDKYTITGKKSASVAEHDDFTQLDIGAGDLASGKPRAEDLNIGGTEGEPTYTAKTLKQLKEAYTGVWNTIDGEDGLKAKYEAARAKDEGATTAKAAAAEKTANAKSAYETALAGGSPVKITINLADNEDNLAWTYDKNDTNGGKEANFYYNYVLGAGQTSKKLIDSVYLDAKTSAAAYKTLVFDLNVGLDSIQVTYDADQRNYSTEAVNAADDVFKMDVTNTGTITDATKLEWKTPTPATP